MIVESTITVGGLPVTVRELTVGEIRARLQTARVAPATDAVQELLFGDFRATDLLDFSDLSAAQFEAAKPSELRALWERVEQVNADFFGLRRRLLTVAATLPEEMPEGAPEVTPEVTPQAADATPSAASSAPPSP